MSDSTLLNSEASPPPSPQQPAGHDFFRSPNLLFVFLRVCIFMLLSYGISLALQFIAAAFEPQKLSLFSPKRLAITEAIPFLGTFAAGLVMSRLEKRRFGDYGLPFRGFLGRFFWQGALFGFVEISAVIGVIAAFGSYRFGSLAIHGEDLLRWASFWAVFFLVVGLYEEFTFRGYMQFTLAQGVGFWPAALLLSLAFGLVHITNPGENWIGIAGIVLTGLFWSFTLRRGGNLWFAVGMHASFDFGETFLYSVPDSGAVFPGHLSNATLAGSAWLTGGSAGPEASLFDFLIILLFFYVFHRLYPVRSPEDSPTQLA